MVEIGMTDGGTDYYNHNQSAVGTGQASQASQAMA